MDAPVFPKVWEQVEPLIEGLPLVAHNARFDEGCLKAVFKVYQMDYPDYEFYDTLKAARKAFPCAPNHQLHTISALCGYDLTMHHYALADAEACARIAIEILYNYLSLLKSFLLSPSHHAPRISKIIRKTTIRIMMSPNPVIIVGILGQQMLLHCP